MSKNIMLHINKVNKVVFCKSLADDLVNAIAEFGEHILLSATWLKEEITKFSSSIEIEKIKKEPGGLKEELVENKGCLDTALKANEDMSGKLKIVVEAHSRCEVMKRRQNQLDELTMDNKTLREKVELLKSNLTDMIVS